MNKKMALSSAVAAAALGLIFTSAPASAQASRTWVSGVGDDANPCSRTAPCKTYAGAISKTAANGEINCLDPGGFGALTITKSISVVCDYTEGGVLASLTSGFTVNAPAGSIITLKGQDVECFINGINGVRVIGVGVTVHIHKSQFRNCRGGGSGIAVTNSSGVAEVHIDEVYITDNGNAATQAGVLIRPTLGASANVGITRSRMDNNTNGIFMDGNGGGGISNLTVKDSTLNGNSGNGIAVASNATAFKAMVSNSQISANVTTGVAVNGAGATVLLGGNSISGNVTGVTAAASGILQSFKNNQIAANTTDGTPITAFPGPGGPLQ